MGIVMFGRSFVINLPFKKDRLEAFNSAVPKCFGEITVWPAVHGDSIKHPDWWSSGNGAWGCYRSHLQILEYCYQNKIESYIVFEDDAIFQPDAEELTQRFISELPEDWEMIYLGGQLLHESRNPPRKVSDFVYIPYNVNRTHCFAVHQRGYQPLYRHLFGRMQHGEHIDHHLGRIHESEGVKVYVPGRWIVGQDSGPSNISGRMNAATYWVDPEKLASDSREWTTRYVPAVFLEAPIEVAIDLERSGWHRGHWQNNERLDRGVCSAVMSTNVRGGLDDWRRAVMPEAVREGKSCICLYHPSLTWEVAKDLEPPYARIVATTSDQALDELSKIIAEHDKAGVRNQTLRNLIYHIYPRKGNGVWQWNIQELLKRIDLFDGVRSIAVVTDENTDTVEDVKAAVAAYRIDNWIVMSNNPSLGEVVTHAVLLDTLPHDDSITFRAHAKAVRHDGQHNTQRWAQVMYEVCLDDIEHVESDLEQHSVTGAFKRSPVSPGFGWHYSGSFYWFKNADLFASPKWREISQDYFGVEKWPGDVFHSNKGGSLFGHGVGSLYKDDVWAWVTPWLETWKSAKKTMEAV